jgi:hypothetical protein
MGLLAVPRAAAGRTQPVHHADQVEQSRPGDVVRTGQHLELGCRSGVRTLGQRTGERERQVGLAVDVVEQDHGGLGRRGDQPLSERARRLVRDGDRDARLLEELPVRVLRGGDEHGARLVQHLPGRPGQQAGRDAGREPDEDDPPGHRAGGAGPCSRRG